MPSYESSRLAAIVMRTGKLFLQYGGDVSSVADTMKQICNTQPWVRNPECIVTPTSLLFSFKAGVIHSSVEGHLGSFQLLAIINKAAMNILEHVSFLPVGTSSRYMPRRGIVGSSGSTMSNFLRNHQIDFQSGCTSL